MIFLPPKINYIQNDLVMAELDVFKTVYGRYVKKKDNKQTNKKTPKNSTLVYLKEAIFKNDYVHKR